ncbi:porphobilinogen deaminase [Cordyceps militaris CM01]|uniref:hydroxymethylbilane synthase n=1 Tax=Cordyceps militaris (strain CM01) TaxID=983644 RepID=G3J7Z9_CORMM|nr:porphobilinogen deaminase [Cordyceps militaris CM01]EGX97210.1 porphobilinogen deaminase [Cordyceps militaris CM01]
MLNTTPNAINGHGQHGQAHLVPPHHLSEVVVGCRKSELALVQARAVIVTLTRAMSCPPTFKIATGSAVGDVDKQTPFLLLSKQQGGSDVGKSLWTNNLEKNMLAGDVQLLVHSLKDMPTTLLPKCLLAAVPEREDPTDAVIMRTGSQFTSIDQLPAGSIVGSSSSRRRALVRRNWPSLEVAECRGNVDTRLAKLDAPSSPFACILLATAGLARLGLKDRITQRLDPRIFPPAVGQGALGIEVSTDREDTVHLVRHADHKPSRWRCMAERAMLRSLQGGCSSPIGASSSWDPTTDNRLRLQATVLDIEGTTSIFAEAEGIVQDDEAAEQLGVAVADILFEKGAHQLLRK